MTFSDHGQRDVGQGREVPRCADAAFFRDLGQNVVVQHVEQQLEGRPSQSGTPGGHHVGPKQHQRAHQSILERRAHADRMTPDQIDLQLGQVVVRDADLRKVPETRVDAVDGPPRLGFGIDQGPGPVDASDGVVAERDPSAARGHPLYVFQGQPTTVDAKLGHSAGR